MSVAPAYEVKSPAAILAEDVICQSFIQSSSTLAYACLLIRQGKYDLAAHVLHSLEAKPASRFKDMVFYLQAQIGIETGDFGTIKKRLVPRVHQHPNDMVALSLLESCIAREWEAWQREHPAEAALTAALAQAQASAPAPAAPRVEEAVQPVSAPRVSVSASEPSPTGPAPERIKDRAAELTLSGVEALMPLDLDPEPIRSTVPIRQIPAAAEPSPSPAAFIAEGGDFGVYQGLAADAQAHALLLWNTATRKLRSAAKREELQPLVSLLPQIIPQPIAAAVRALDGGEIHKICFCFGNLTVTTFHSGPDNLGLLTGNLNQSLLTMVRAENLFQRQSPLSNSARGTAAGTISRESAMEVSSNE